MADLTGFQNLSSLAGMPLMVSGRRVGLARAPVTDLLIHLHVAREPEVAHLGDKADVMVVRRFALTVTRLRVSRRHAHQAIAQENGRWMVWPVAQGADDHVVAGVGQPRHMALLRRCGQVIVVDKRAVAQVLDALARHVDDVADEARDGVGDSVQRVHGRMADFHQRRALVRRSQVEHLAHLLHPCHLGGRGVVARAADDQAAHAVADENDVAHIDGIIGEQLAEELCQPLAIVGDGQASVVEQIERRVAQVALEEFAVGCLVLRRVWVGEHPRAFATRQAVDQDADVRGCVGVSPGESNTGKGQQAPCAIEGHLNGQPIVAGAQIVADVAVDEADAPSGPPPGATALPASVIH